MTKEEKSAQLIQFVEAFPKTLRELRAHAIIEEATRHRSVLAELQSVEECALNILYKQWFDMIKDGRVMDLPSNYVNACSYVIQARDERIKLALSIEGI